MIIYSTTFNVENEILSKWKAWMVSDFIPGHYATGTFTSHLFASVKVDEEMGGNTYSLQLFTASENLLRLFQDNNQEQLDAKLFANFNGKFVLFRTQLIVEDHQLNELAKNK